MPLMTLEREYARVVDNLPSESSPPQILKQSSRIYYNYVAKSLSSPTWNDLDLGDYAERYLVDAFSSVPNVGRILVGGS